MKTVLKFKRFPAFHDPTLKAFNAADEYLLDFALKYLEKLNSKNVLILNDRFGFLTISLAAFHNVTALIESHGQLTSIQTNLQINELDESRVKLTTELPIRGNFDMILIKVPKSLTVWNRYLLQVQSYTSNQTELVAAFMTKYFTKRILDIGKTYFKEVNQSLAIKKSRIIRFKVKKDVKTHQESSTSTMNVNDSLSIDHFTGSFGKNKIDSGTQFLIDHWDIVISGKKILDIGSGNGIISAFLNQINPGNQYILIEDNFNSHKVGQRNLSQSNFQHIWDHTLDQIKPISLDLIVSNPPFHFEYEIDFNIPFDLMYQAHRKLKKDGILVIVANKHINYFKQFERYFNQVEIRHSNKKFNIIIATK